MTVENLGVKLYQGLKQDRVSDSLGSSGDGVNTNVTIPLTWTNLTSNTSIANSKLNYTETASTYIRASRDLDGVITLADDFVIRFELNKTNNPTNESNGTQPLISISSSLADAWFNAQDAIGMYLTQNSSGQTNGYFAVACDNQVTYNGDSSVNSYTWTTGTLYFEVIKNSTADTVTVTAYTNSDYSTGGQGTASISTSGKTISGLRYLSMRNFADSQRPSVVFELDNLKIYNNKTSATGTPDVSDDFATNSGSGQKLGTGCYDYAGGDASSPRVELGDDLADWTFLTDGSDWTWVGWWNPDSLTVTGSVYGSSLLYTMAGGSTANTGMNIYVDGEGDLWGLMLRSVGSSYVFTNTDSGANIVAGEWQHLAVVHDGTSSTKTMKFYVNGALGGTITGTGNAYSSAENPRQPMIGGVGSGTLGWSSGYDGKSDDMAFYKRKLSVTEIQALVNQGATTNTYKPSTMVIRSSDVYDPSSQTNQLDGLFFKPDGLKMYIASRAGSSYAIYQYTLSTPYDVSTASYASISFPDPVSADIRGMSWKPDGSRWARCSDQTGNKKFYDFTTSSNWDISTSSSASNFQYVSYQSGGKDVIYGDSGNQVTSLADNASINTYDLSTPYTVSSASDTAKDVILSSIDNAPRSHAWNSDGTKCFYLGAQNDKVYQLDCSTPWDITSYSHSAANDIDVSSESADPYGLWVKNEVTPSAIYVGSTNSPYSVYQYGDVVFAGTAFATVGQ